MTAFSGIQSKPSSLKRTPFNQTAARFLPLDYKARSAPGRQNRFNLISLLFVRNHNFIAGPGQYRIAGFADENLRRAVVEGGKKPPFNVASLRRLDMARRDEFNMPGER